MENLSFLSNGGYGGYGGFDGTPYEEASVGSVSAGSAPGYALSGEGPTVAEAARQNINWGPTVAELPASAYATTPDRFGNLPEDFGGIWRSQLPASGLYAHGSLGDLAASRGIDMVSVYGARAQPSLLSLYADTSDNVLHSWFRDFETPSLIGPSTAAAISAESAAAAKAQTVQLEESAAPGVEPKYTVASPSVDAAQSPVGGVYDAEVSRALASRELPAQNMAAASPTPLTRAQAQSSAAAAGGTPLTTVPDIDVARMVISEYEAAGGKLNPIQRELKNMTEEAWAATPAPKQQMYLARAQVVSRDLPVTTERLTQEKGFSEDSRDVANRNLLAASSTIKAGPGLTLISSAQETMRKAEQAYASGDYARANSLYTSAAQTASQASANPKATVEDNFFYNLKADGTKPMNFGNITMFVGMLGGLFSTLYSQPKAAKDQMKFQERMAQRQFEQQKELIALRQGGGGGGGSSSGKGAGPAAMAAPSLANARYTT